MVDMETVTLVKVFFACVFGAWLVVFGLHVKSVIAHRRGLASRKGKGAPQEPWESKPVRVVRTADYPNLGETKLWNTDPDGNPVPGPTFKSLDQNWKFGPVTDANGPDGSPLYCVYWPYVGSICHPPEGSPVNSAWLSYGAFISKAPALFNALSMLTAAIEFYEGSQDEGRKRHIDEAVKDARELLHEIQRLAPLATEKRGGDGPEQ